MKYNKLGRTDLNLSEVGLGTWEISGDVWGKKDDAESLKAIHTALDLGVNYIDTAAGYGSGHSETLIGQVLGERKADNVSVSTKILPKCLQWAPPPHKEIDEFFPPDWIVEQCEASLKRLNIERIGILFLHTWSRSWGHRTEWYEAMLKLKQQGKIQAIGISIPDEGIADANVHVEGGRVDVIQCVYNVFQQEPEHVLFPLARKHNVGIVARSPFSSGALTGHWTKEIQFSAEDWRGRWPKSIKDNWLEEQVEMSEAVRQVISHSGREMSEVAIRYVLDNPNVTSTIPGSANPKHVRANINVVSTPSLDKQIQTELRDLWLNGTIHGTYNGSI
ncbi:MAG: aldo/keto reductase [Chloroflexi bacterium]|nr:aldo/keto reductase [Chloroflexota bacterium]